MKKDPIFQQDGFLNKIHKGRARLSLRRYFDQWKVLGLGTEYLNV